MKIIYSGAEVSSHRTLLMGAGVTAIGINYWLLRKRLPKHKKFLLRERIPEGVEVYLTSGGPQLNMVSESDLALYVDEYTAFISENSDRITAATDVDCYTAGGAGRSQLLVAQALGGIERLWIVWHPEATANLETLGKWKHVALTGSVIESQTLLAGRVRAIQAIHGTTWHAIAHARPDDLRSLPVATVSTLAWLTPMLRGETIVWDGHRIVRYPKKMKDQARKRLAAICQRAGLDHDLIMQDDHNEVTKLALWSYMALEKNNERSAMPVLVDNYAEDDDPGNAETGMVAADKTPPQVRKAIAPIQRPAHEQMVLPIFGVETKTVVDHDENGRPTLRDVPVLQSQTGPLRQCNTCFVAASCPAFVPNNACAFHLPVEVKTKDQLLSLLQAMIEMQAARAAFGRFAEELQGGYPDPNVSQEIDRLFKLVERLKDIQSDREFIQITAERRGAGGVLSAIFGDKAASLRELPNGGLNEEQTTRVIRDLGEAA